MLSQEPIFFSELETIKPILIKDVLLICPGTWNDVNYTGAELKKAFTNTDWTDKSNTHLYLDHQDTQKKGVGNWAGFVKNIKLVGSDLYGDLELWDLQVATYLKAAKAKFGVSATLKGIYNEKLNRMENFSYESFSIVTDPACAPAYINLAKEKELLTGEKTVDVTLGKLDLIESKGGLNNNMFKKEKKLEEEAKEESAEAPKEEAKEEPKEESESKEAPKEEAEEENLSVKGLKELSGKFDSLSTKLDELISVFKKSLQEEKPEEKAEEASEEESSKEAPEEKEDELSNIKKELAILQDKLNKPVSKTLSSSAGASNADPDLGMLNFLKQKSLLN